MRAVILAGGKGARLKPYTIVLPKPLMPIGEYPILEVIVRQLIDNDFDHITMAVNHQAEIIQAFFGNGEKWGVKIDYSLEDQPLGTMGPLKIIRDLPDDFLVMNGDILTDLNYRSFFEHHVANQNIFTISSFKRELRSEYGVLKINEENRLVGFQEKPSFTFDVSMGIYMANKEVLPFIPKEGVSYGFDQLMLDLIAEQKPASIKTHQGSWLDIGRPDDYCQAIDEFEAKRDLFLKS